MAEISTSTMKIVSKVKQFLSTPKTDVAEASKPQAERKFRHLRTYVHSQNQDFDFDEITLEQLQELERQVYDRFQIGMFGFGIKSVRPEVFAEEYSPTWERFVEIHHKHAQSIREFGFAFLGQDPDGKALADFNFFQLQISLRGKYASDETFHNRKATLRSHGCSPHDFEVFSKLAVKCLGLRSKAIPKPTQSEDLYSKWKHASQNPDLFDLIDATMKAAKHDLALKAAVGLVESRLREKCVSLGRTEASHQTGADLAVTAFHKDTGCLTPPWPIATEAVHGTFLLFNGFFSYLRNAYAHHTVVMGKDITAVLECLLTCEFLLLLISKSTTRPQAPIVPKTPLPLP
jgi:hypothetical protein